MKSRPLYTLIAITIISVFAAMIIIAYTPLPQPQNTVSGQRESSSTSQLSVTSVSSSISIPSVSSNNPNSLTNPLQINPTTTLTDTTYSSGYPPPQNSQIPPTQRSCAELQYDIQYAEQQFYIAQNSAEGGVYSPYSGTNNNGAIAMSAWVQQEQFYYQLYLRALSNPSICNS